MDSGWETSVGENIPAEGRHLPPRESAEGGKKSGGRSVVAKGVADVGVAIDVARTEDKASAKLEGVLTAPVLPVAGGSRPLPGCGVIPAEHVEQRGVSKACNAIRFPILINQERKGDACVLAKKPSILPVA